MNRESKKRRFKEVYFALMIVLILADILVLLLRSRGIYVEGLERVGYFPVYVSHIVFIVCSIFLLPLPRQFIYIGLVSLLSLSVGVLFVAYLFAEVKRTEVTAYPSPQGQQTLVVAYRAATLGESTHFYTFYQRVDPWGVFMRKLEGQEWIFRTEDLRGRVVHPQWPDETTAVFRIEDRTLTVTLDD